MKGVRLYLGHYLLDIHQSQLAMTVLLQELENIDREDAERLRAEAEAKAQSSAASTSGSESGHGHGSDSNNNNSSNNNNNNNNVNSNNHGSGNTNSSANNTPRGGAGNQAANAVITPALTTSAFPAPFSRSVWVHEAIARSMYQQQQYEQCLEACKKALGLCVDHNQVLQTLAITGHVYYQQGRLNAAVRSYTACLAWDPAESQLDKLLLWRLAEIYSEVGLHSESMEVALRLCRVAPSSWAYCVVGRSLMELKQYHQAICALTKANHLNKMNAQVWGYLTCCCIELNDVDKATHAFKQCLTLGLDDPAVYTRVASGFYSLGRLDTASTAAQEAGYLDPSSAVMELLGDIKWKQNFCEEGLGYYRQAYTVLQTSADARAEGSRGGAEREQQAVRALQQQRQALYEKLEAAEREFEVQPQAAF